MIEEGNGQKVIADLSFIYSFKESIIDCLIVLNSDIPAIQLKNLVNCSRNIILSDGGANNFYQSEYRDSTNVKAIVGDLDSIQPHVRQYYQHKNVDIKDLSHDQDTNDLQKSVAYALQTKPKTIVCLGILGRRFDQEMCNLSVLQRYSTQEKDVSFIGLGTSSLIYLVKPYIETTIKLNHNLFIKNQAGMIVFGKAKVQTKGFKWNLGKEYGLQQLEWGVLVSSSNEVVGEEVQIKTNYPLFFTIEFK